MFGPGTSVGAFTDVSNATLVVLLVLLFLAVDVRTKCLPLQCLLGRCR